MNVLFCAAEAAPLVKVGGLADVVGSLPSALQALGHDVRIILPFYGVLRERVGSAEIVAGPIHFHALGQEQEIYIRQTALPPHQTPLYLVDWPGQFSGEAYDTKQEAADIEEGVRRFILWSWAVAHALPHLPWKPDFLHVHDWHAAAIPTFRQHLGQSPLPSLLTIHNLSIQGRWNPNQVAAWLGIDLQRSPSLHVRDAAGDLNMMLLGIYGCHSVSTVSPTYAREILQPAYGEKLERDLEKVGVVGIVNGIDTDVFNPETDPLIHQTYSITTVETQKPLNAESLRQQVGLPPSTGPLFGFIGRFTPQKGLDILLDATPELVRLGGQLLILGSGFPELEARVQQLQQEYPRAVRVVERFDATLAQQMYAGLNALIMPSRFEPCGLGQLIAMRYGTTPLVADTGGLHDTVIDFRLDPEHGVGYVVEHNSSASLIEGIDAFSELYRSSAVYWKMVRRSMERDSSWYTSAQAYDTLYADITKKHPHNPTGTSR